MVDKLAAAMDKNDHAVGVFVDLSKAFDTVNQDIPLGKLSNYGARGPTYNIIFSYLSGRAQYVSYNSAMSAKQDVVCGVPQGSILGPLLFLVYVDDMQNCSKLLNFILFADDTNLFITAKKSIDIISLANIELEKLGSCFKANKLSLNVNKSKYIYFRSACKGSSCSVGSLRIDNSIIEKVPNIKFLGIIIDKSLSWKAHVVNISKMISRNIGVCKRIRHKVDFKTATLLYDTMILPYFSYCNIIWANCSKYNLKKLYKLQKRAIRVIFYVNSRTHSAPLFRKLQRFNIYDIYKSQLCHFMYLSINRLLPVVFDQYFCQNINIHGHNTRSALNIHCNYARTNARASSIRINGPVCWNGLPVHVRNSVSLKKVLNSICYRFMVPVDYACVYFIGFMIID